MVLLHVLIWSILKALCGLNNPWKLAWESFIEYMILQYLTACKIPVQSAIQETVLEEVFYTSDLTCYRSWRQHFGLSHEIIICLLFYYWSVFLHKSLSFFRKCCQSDLGNLRSLVSTFLWQGKRPRVAYSRLMLPREKGGYGLPDIPSHTQYFSDISPIGSSGALLFLTMN